MRASVERLLRAEIDQAEGVDRPAPSLLARGIRDAAATRAALSRAPRSCSGGPVVVIRQAPELREPQSGEAFFGRVRAGVPPGATHAALFLNGRLQRRWPVRPPAVTTRLSGPAGPSTVAIRFFSRSGKLVGRPVSRDTWLLPASASVATSAGRESSALDAGLRAIGTGSGGYSAMWVQDLRTGVYGSWNAGVRFPAASTVKLAVLTAALRKFGPRPERSPAAYDLGTLAGWSSNLAANRLVAKLGGRTVVQRELARLGATSSTYPGDYRVGTAVRPAGGAPPLVSGRVTTALDLARILGLLQSAATGKARGSGLTVHEARVGLRDLLASKPSGDNLGLFRPWLARSFPMAQKNGWLHDARHTAAILYAPGGPKLVVLLTYRPGETREQAARLGREVLRLALR
jgi:beta-lactamase class A